MCTGCERKAVCEKQRCQRKAPAARATGHTSPVTSVEAVIASTEGLLRQLELVVPPTPETPLPAALADSLEHERPTRPEKRERAETRETTIVQVTCVVGSEYWMP